jgi:hypothetical protein
VKFAGIEKYDLLRIQGLDKIPRYVNLAFEIDFPYIRVANSIHYKGNDSTEIRIEKVQEY